MLSAPTVKPPWDEPAQLTTAQRLAAEQALGGSIAVVAITVAQADGSVPRGPGTTLLVDAHGIFGTIGGGRLEFEAIATARTMLLRHATGDEPAAIEQSIGLGPSLGQCCGGRVRLRFVPVTAQWLAACTTTTPLFDLMLYGAGHVGQAIARVLSEVDCRVRWVDARDAPFVESAEASVSQGEATETPSEVIGAQTQVLGTQTEVFDKRSRSPWPVHIERVATEPLEAEASSAPAGAFHLVLTHEHALDLRIVEAILRRDRFGWLGLIGSQTKRARFAHRLAERGIGAASLARLHCPIGVAGITGKSPEIIAIAVVAQLLQQAEISAPCDRI